MLKFDQNLQDSNWQSDGEEEEEASRQTLNEILLNPKMLGDEREMVVELKPKQGVTRLVQLTHNEIVFNE